MPRLKNTSTLTLSPFEQQLKKVLKWFHDPARIGKESPLASPYFLSGLVQRSGDAQSPQIAVEQGKLLCLAIQEAAQALWGGTPPQSLSAMRQALLEIRDDPSTARYAYIVLELRCFQQFLRPERTSEIWLNAAYLPGSQSEHYRDYDAAVVQLGRVLLAQLHPSLRNEQPPQVPPLIGYDAAIAQVQTAVMANQSMSICGAGGVGKSALAATVVRRVERPIFWYTVRPTLNDHLASLLFAVGHFLQRHGVSQLWQLVLASGGTLDNYELALGALREDLATFPEPQPLFCFDELELLQHNPGATKGETGIGESTSQRHAVIVAFLEELATTATLLLIGQQSILVTEQTLMLTGLATPAIMQLFAQATSAISPAEAKQLLHTTLGNPRLLALCLTLHQRGEAIAEICNSIGQEPALIPLLQRIHSRLSRSEQELMAQLAVYRRPAPAANWSDTGETMAQLRQKRLITMNDQGGVEVVPALRPHLYTMLDGPTKMTGHCAAASVRLYHAEYSAAAYHLVQGGQPAAAVQLWYTQREVAIQRGEAGAAFALFQQVDTTGFDEGTLDALAIIQAELHKRRGAFADGLATLERAVSRQDQQDPTVATETRILIDGLRAEFLELLGDPATALVRYEAALQTTSRVLSHQVMLHRQRSILHVRQRDLCAAWQEVARADCQLQIVRGILADEEGRYDDAQLIFEQVLTQAQALADQSTMALAERHLANTHGRRQELQAAERYAQQAIQRYESLGDAFNVARVYDNLAFSYLHTKAIAQGIAAARKAYQFFVAAKSTYYSAIVATNLAEAYCDAGDLHQAEQYAHVVLDSEERQPLPYALFTLGRIHEHNQAWQHARHSFVESLRVAIENEDRFMEAYARRALGVVLQAMGEGDAARRALEEALVLFQALAIEGEVAETERLLLNE